MIAAQPEQVVKIDRLMGAVEIADTDMQDTRTQPRAVVGRPLGRRGQAVQGRGRKRRRSDVRRGGHVSLSNFSPDIAAIRPGVHLGHHPEFAHQPILSP
ncbi:hypothetical protein ACFOHS_20675 [Jhaorihella thermophila]